jgi:hypothetical protein
MGAAAGFSAAKVARVRQPRKVPGDLCNSQFCFSFQEKIIDTVNVRGDRSTLRA